MSPGPSAAAAAALDVLDSIERVSAEAWDAAVAASGAPVFYERRYLRAYEASPVVPFEAAAYLVVRDGSAAAVLPAFVQPEVDPLGALREAFPALRLGGRGLVTPGWHCYDAWIPATRLEPWALDRLLDGLRDVARSVDVDWLAFVNVAEDAAVRELLEAAGPVASGRIDERFWIDLGGYESFDAYFASLRPKVRENVRRYARRAADAGAEIQVSRAADADLDAIVDLARQTSARHGTGDFYRAGPFQEFVRGLGDSAVAVELRLRGRLAAAGVCLLDPRRFHLWACGVDYAAGRSFSPYALLFVESVRSAFERGVPIVEGGRRNGEFKTRFGMRGRVLHAYVFRVD